jgi:hypothetical protein
MVLENDSTLDLVGMEAGRGARVNPWHVDRDQACGVGFRPPALLAVGGRGHDARTARPSEKAGKGILWLPPLARTISRGAMILSMASLATCVFGP